MEEQLQPIRQPMKRIKGNKTLESIIVAKHVAGETKTQIAEDLNTDRNLIARVLNDSEVLQYVEYGRSRAVSLIPKSLDVAEYRLAKNDGSMALGILRGTKVLQNEPV